MKYLHKSKNFLKSYLVMIHKFNYFVTKTNLIGLDFFLVYISLEKFLRTLLINRPNVNT